MLGQGTESHRLSNIHLSTQFHDPGEGIIGFFMTGVMYKTISMEQ